MYLWKRARWWAVRALWSWLSKKEREEEEQRQQQEEQKQEDGEQEKERDGVVPLRRQ